MISRCDVNLEQSFFIEQRWNVHLCFVKSICIALRWELILTHGMFVVTLFHNKCVALRWEFVCIFLFAVCICQYLSRAIALQYEQHVYSRTGRFARLTLEHFGEQTKVWISWSCISKPVVWARCGLSWISQMLTRRSLFGRLWHGSVWKLQSDTTPISTGRWAKPRHHVNFGKKMFLPRHLSDKHTTEVASAWVTLTWAPGSLKWSVWTSFTIGLGLLFASWQTTQKEDQFFNAQMIFQTFSFLLTHPKGFDCGNCFGMLQLQIIPSFVTNEFDLDWGDW